MSIAGDYVREVHACWDPELSDLENRDRMVIVVQKYADQVILFEKAPGNELIWHYQDESASHIGPDTAGIQVWKGTEGEIDDEF